MTWSRIALSVCIFSLIFTSIVYYPRWNKPMSEATIGWDVSGYYAYLPAVFIYHDLRYTGFIETMREKYHFTPSPMQGSRLPNGRFVIKYSMGQALQMLPWFICGHLGARVFNFPADGYSLPYQVAQSFGSLLLAFLGLWLARRVLLTYFNEPVTALTLLALVLGSNYLNYATIDGAMTHNWLFTCTVGLVYLTIRFYEKPSYWCAAGIGILVGWAILTRPTEAIVCMIPVLWGVYHIASFRERLLFIWMHKSRYALAIALASGIAGMQALYWKYTSGQWFYYSYGTEHFTWRDPKLEEILISYRCGWLVYSPIMTFAIVGLAFMYKLIPRLWLVVLTFVILGTYIASTWSTWWYGGTLGMRALVQHYAIWMFPLAAFIATIYQNKFFKWTLLPLMTTGIYLNVWWTREAHTGHAFVSEQMTPQFFKRVVGRLDWDESWLKLLDVQDIYTGALIRPDTLISHDFEQDSTQVGSTYPLSGAKDGFVDKAHQFSGEWKAAAPMGRKWFRASCIYAADTKEWDLWRMTQFILRFYKEGKSVQESSIRLHRFIQGGETKQLHFDIKAPTTPFDSVSVFFWNAESDKRLRFDDVRLVAFDE